MKSCSSIAMGVKSKLFFEFLQFAKLSQKLVILFNLIFLYLKLIPDLLKNLMALIDNTFIEFEIVLEYLFPRETTTEEFMSRI